MSVKIIAWFGEICWTFRSLLLDVNVVDILVFMV